MPREELPKYLRPDFDPKSIKMDLIRDILIQHNVKPPTGVVRKQELIDLFNTHIKPQVPALRHAHESVVPSEEGIIKVPRGKGTILQLFDDDHDDSDSKPTVKKTAPKRSKSSVRSEEEAPVVARPRRSTSRARLDTKDSQPEEESTSRGRKPRRSTMESDGDDITSPSNRSRRKESISKEKAKRNDNFSDENPFQSSTKAERTRSKSRDKSTSRPRSSSRSRSKKVLAPKERAHSPVFKVPDQPFSRFMHSPAGGFPDRGVSGSSTFPSSSATPRTSSRKVAEKDLPPPKTLFLSTDDAASGVHEQDWGQYFRVAAYLLAAILIPYGLWYRQTRVAIGFCPGNDNLNNIQSSNWLYPSCIPCPDHAECLAPDADPICSPEYLLKPHLLSFGNLIPLSPVCVLNKAKEYQSLQLADAAEKTIHLKAGIEECKISRISNHDKLTRQRILQDDVRRELEKSKDEDVSEEDFEQFWEMALKELRRRSDKVIFEKNAEGATIRSLRPTKTLGCRLRQALVRLIIKFKFAFICALITLIGGFGLYYKLNQRRKNNRIVNGLVANVLAKLSNQAHYYYVDPVLYPDPFLSQLHLRDALLANVHSPTQRQELWENVVNVVEKNSNVRIGSQDIRGEPHRTWEWVGASGVLSQNASEPMDKNDEIRGSSSSYGHGVAKPLRRGPNGSFFGMHREDSEFLNPLNPMYPSLSQEYDTFEQQ
ncbi:inner nuclear membrane protein enriched at telomere/subtelomere region [Podila epigama]|nr:inner nuclear membrane protein enriched at telomere/subtelomere region [Podila epigama]